MEKIKEFLRLEHQKKALVVFKDCLSIEELCDYVDGKLHLGKRKRIEAHIATCYSCLDTIVSIYESIKYYSKRRHGMKREGLFLIMAVGFFILSFIFSRYFLQFLAAAIILSLKWIVDSKNSKILITIYEAWKRGGERETGRLLKEMEREKHIDL